MDTNVLVAIISALIAARGQRKRQRVQEVGPTTVIVKKRRWRTFLWIIAILFAFLFILSLTRTTIHKVTPTGSPYVPPKHFPPLPRR